tara:strand:- start:913 stop:1518 length:606 start_codon:yes stop_codon:yes gene_type:complete
MLFSPNRFNINKFKNLIEKKNNIVLDYGSGVGVWDHTNLDPKIKKIFLYDPNDEVIKISKKKYKKNNKFYFVTKKSLFSKNFLNRNKVNIILLNSVAQYIHKKELQKLLIYFKKEASNRKLKIIITDIPTYPRFIEIFLLLLFDFLRFWHAIKLIFSKEYHDTLFYRNNLDIKYLKTQFKITKDKNLNNFRFRKTFILKKN